MGHFSSWPSAFGSFQPPDHLCSLPSHLTVPPITTFTSSTLFERLTSLRNHLKLDLDASTHAGGPNPLTPPLPNLSKMLLTHPQLPWQPLDHMTDCVSSLHPSFLHSCRERTFLLAVEEHMADSRTSVRRFFQSRIYPYVLTKQRKV